MSGTVLVPNKSPSARLLDIRRKEGPASHGCKGLFYFRSLLEKGFVIDLVVIRNNHEVARVVPGPATMSALEAMADLYRTLPEEAAEGWIEDSRLGGEGVREEVRDPWDS